VIDLHCHILPGIDDGPTSLDESVELARLFESDGVRTVAATPHLRADHPGVVPGELGERCADLTEALRRAGVRLEVVPAGEVDLFWALDAAPDDLRLASFAQRGTDLLVETPYGPLASTFEDHLFRLTVQGFRVLLAHPERNPTFQDIPERLAELVRRGILVQVTAASLTRPPRRSRSARCARRLLGEGLVHVLSSDAHGPAALDRAPLPAGCAVAREIVGPRADWLCVDAPRAVLAGAPLPSPPLVGASRLTRGSWFRR
jgi:protein-tyrosine phosphatase